MIANVRPLYRSISKGLSGGVMSGCGYSENDKRGAVLVPAAG